MKPTRSAKRTETSRRSAAAGRSAVSTARGPAAIRPSRTRRRTSSRAGWPFRRSGKPDKRRPALAAELPSRLVLGAAGRTSDHVGHVFTLFRGRRALNRVRLRSSEVAIESIGAGDELSPTRAWWLRVPAVLLSPRSVFFALREDDADDVAARSEPLLLVIWLAGGRACWRRRRLPASWTTPTTTRARRDLGIHRRRAVRGRRLRRARVRALLRGATAREPRRLPARAADGRVRARADGAVAAPRAAAAARALRRATRSTPEARTRARGRPRCSSLQLAFAAWSLGLLVVGVRVTHGWTWLRRSWPSSSAVPRRC